MIKIIKWKQSLSTSETWGEIHPSPEKADIFIESYIWHIRHLYYEASRAFEADVSADFVDGDEILFVEWEDEAGVIHTCTDASQDPRIDEIRCGAYGGAYLAIDEESLRDNAAYDGLD